MPKNSGRGSRDQSKIFPARGLISEQGRKIENLVRVGTITKADYKAGKARVGFGDPTTQDQLETHWLPFSAGNSAHNRTWSPPEVGEQVMVLSPSGDLSAGVIQGAIPQKAFPLDADSPDIRKTTMRNPKTGEIAIWDEWNRESGVRRFHIWEQGAFRWEVGAKSNIIMDGDHIQLRVGKTQLVIKDGSISLLVDGNEVSLVVDKTSVTSQVKGKSIFQLTESVISLMMPGGMVGLKMAADSLKAMVATTWLNLTSDLATLVGGDSGVDLTGGVMTISAPTVNATNAPHFPGVFDSTDVAAPDVPETLKAPDPSKGNPPSMPTI